MIQAYAGDKMVVGVTRGNIERLTAGRPLMIQLVKSVEQILVVFGESKLDIIQQLEDAGLEFAESAKAAAEADPS